IRILRGDLPRPDAAHRVSHQINVVLVDLVLLLHVREDLHHVLLAELLRPARRRVIRRIAEPPAVRSVDAIAERSGDDVAVLLGQPRQLLSYPSKNESSVPPRPWRATIRG